MPDADGEVKTAAYPHTARDVLGIAIQRPPLVSFFICGESNDQNVATASGQSELLPVYHALWGALGTRVAGIALRTLKDQKKWFALPAGAWRRPAHGPEHRFVRDAKGHSRTLHFATVPNDRYR